TVAAGDVDGKPGDELITGAGPGAGPRVKVFGADGGLRLSFNAYGPNFHGGVFVAAGDVNADGHADVITGAGTGAAPVKVFSGTGGPLLASFFPLRPPLRGGGRLPPAPPNPPPPPATRPPPPPPPPA